jgi:pyruvate dehydrogenase E2 component (dihydrolipoamide acetyltransferase)
VRKLAADLGVDLARVTGTGDSGMITRADVVGATSGAAESAPTAAGAREKRTPIKGVRKATAEAMVRSAFTAPHVTEFLTIDVTPTTELIAQLREKSGQRVTMLSIVSKALCIAVGRNPSLNSRWDEAAQEIVEFDYVNLGIAVATPRGLMVPNIPDADALSLAELTSALADLATTARDGLTKPASLVGGTISITNVGVFGVDAGTPILNPGEAAILAMGAVRRTPWEFRGEIALRDVMTLSLSFDHRLVDGAQGSRFLTDIGAILSNPGMVLTMV